MSSPDQPPISDLPIRIKSLHRLVTRLLTLVEGPTYVPPNPLSRQALEDNLDVLCDEVERILWKLGGKPNA